MAEPLLYVRQAWRDPDYVNTDADKVEPATITIPEQQLSPKEALALAMAIMEECNAAIAYERKLQAQCDALKAHNAQQAATAAGDA